MKKLVLVLLAGGLFVACNNDAAIKEQQEIKNEILSIDSVNTEMDKLKNEIEESTEELDNLLNEL